MSQCNSIATGKLGRNGFGSLELIDHVAFGHFHFTDLDRKAQLFRLKFHRNPANPNFTGKGMGSGIATLGRIAQRQQESLIPPRQALQARRSVHRKFNRGAGDITRRCLILGCFWGFH